MNTLQPANGQPEKQLNNVVNEPQTTVAQDFLTLCYVPGHKYLEACWQRPVSSKEYRQGIRSIAVCVATLHAHLLLVNFIEAGTPSIADQNWTATFLQQVLKHSTLRSCARILSEEASQLFAHEVIVDRVQKFPYNSQVFTSSAEAKGWLFQEIQPGSAQGKCITIPLNFSLQQLRKLNVSVTDDTTVPKQTPAATKETAVTTKCRTEYVEINIDHRYNMLTLRWLRAPQSREYRYGMLKASRAVVEHRLEKMLLNNSKLGLLTMADQSWVVKTTTEIALRANLKRLAIISSPDSMQQTMSDSICSKLESMNLPYTLQYFLTEDEAKGWLTLLN